jgi:hypothetical protein
MSAESTAKVMDGYWSGHDPEALAGDAVFTLVASGGRPYGWLIPNTAYSPLPS